MTDDRSDQSGTSPALPQLLATRAAFEDVYRLEYPGLVAVATALAGDAEAEDLVQDTMLKALIRWDHVGDLDRPGAWCHHVLVNACRSLHRRITVQRRFLARLRRQEPATSGPTPDVLAFWTAVRRLPERPRMVMALHYAGDLTVPDVAAILGVPEGTVRSDLTRARAALENELR